jgi:hypothetical protein
MTKQDSSAATKPTASIAEKLKEFERQPSTPGFFVNLINFLRLSGDFERRFWRDPLRTVPEFKKRLSLHERIRYGPEVRNHQAIADALLFAMEYVWGAAVEGHVVEFGTMTGRTANVLAAAMASFRFKGELHLFDSFEGLPEATSQRDKDSFHVKDGVWSAGTLQGISPSALRAKCRRYLADDRIIIHEGWFKDTIKHLPEGKKFGLIHVDGDLYQSTIDALDPMFGRRMVSEGAALLFDDWNCNRASNQLGERRAWQELVQKYQVEFSDGGDYGWAGHRFTIHRYEVPS